MTAAWKDVGTAPLKRTVLVKTVTGLKRLARFHEGPSLGVTADGRQKRHCWRADGHTGDLMAVGWREWVEAEDKFDPYDELGVARGAGSYEIHAAYKRRVKETHPDAPGGSEEAFKRTGQALTVLTNPEKRAQFDRDGAVPADENPEKRAQILIANVMSGIFTEFFKSGFKSHLDPTRTDFVGAIAGKLEQQIAQKRVQLEISERMKENFTAVRSRCVGRPARTDPLRDIITASLRDQAVGHDLILKELEIARVALGLVRHYSFKVDEALEEFAGAIWPPQGMR